MIILSGARLALDAAGRPIPREAYPGWLCIQGCVLAAAVGPTALVLGFFALLGYAGRRA